MFEYSIEKKFGQHKDTELWIFLKIILSICETFEKPAERLYMIVHGIDTGDEDPPILFKANQKEVDEIIKEAESSMFGYEVNFRFNHEDGIIEGNCTYKAYIKVKGKDIFIQKIKEICETIHQEFIMNNGYK